MVDERRLKSVYFLLPASHVCVNFEAFVTECNLLYLCCSDMRLFSLSMSLSTIRELHALKLIEFILSLAFLSIVFVTINLYVLFFVNPPTAYRQWKCWVCSLTLCNMDLGLNRSWPSGSGISIVYSLFPLNQWCFVALRLCHSFAGMRKLLALCWSEDL